MPEPVDRQEQPKDMSVEQNKPSKVDTLKQKAGEIRNMIGGPRRALENLLPENMRRNENDSTWQGLIKDNRIDSIALFPASLALTVGGVLIGHPELAIPGVIGTWMHAKGAVEWAGVLGGRAVNKIKEIRSGNKPPERNRPPIGPERPS